MNELNDILGHMRIGRKHDRHRLTDIMNAAGSEDRLVMKGRPIKGLRHDLAYIVDGHDPVYAGERSGVRVRDAAFTIPRILLSIGLARWSERRAALPAARPFVQIR